VYTVVMFKRMERMFYCHWGLCKKKERMIAR
jgi:hypothetical protein